MSFGCESCGKRFTRKEKMDIRVAKKIATRNAIMSSYVHDVWFIKQTHEDNRKIDDVKQSIKLLLYDECSLALRHIDVGEKGIPCQKQKKLLTMIKWREFTLFYILLVF